MLRRDKEDGPGLGERILEILCRHEDTAEFLATKLARYFVDDDPPRRLVDKVAKSYRKRDGDRGQRNLPGTRDPEPPPAVAARPVSRRRGASSPITS